MPRSLHELWPDVCAGDTNAWQELVRRYAALVHTIARRCGLPDLDAEDCAQYVWMQLYQHRKRLREPAKVPSWLTQATKRRAMRVVQNMRRPDPETSLTSETPPAPPDEELIRIEHQVIVRDALEQLDERCRLLLIKLFYSPDEESYNELARKLGVSINTIGPLRARCLKSLKQILKKMGYDLH